MQFNNFYFATGLIGREGREPLVLISATPNRPPPRLGASSGATFVYRKTNWWFDVAEDRCDVQLGSRKTAKSVTPLHFPLPEKKAGICHKTCAPDNVTVPLRTPPNPPSQPLLALSQSARYRNR